MLEEIHGIKHTAFRHAQDLLKPSARESIGQYLVESVNFVQQALFSPSKVKMVFALHEEQSAFRDICKEKGVPLYMTRQGLMQKLVGTSYDTAVTALAVVEKRLLTLEEVLAQRHGLFLAGEDIQDPRNVGVLIRTAESAGCAALLLSANSAEPYSRAAVRSTTGSILRLPLLLCADLPASVARLQETDFSVIASSAKAEALAYQANLGRRPLVLTVGNETNGITENLRAAATDFVKLPMAPNGASSLNVTVAAGVLLYEAIRQGL